MLRLVSDRGWSASIDQLLFSWGSGISTDLLCRALGWCPSIIDSLTGMGFLNQLINDSSNNLQTFS